MAADQGNYGVGVINPLPTQKRYISQRASRFRERLVFLFFGNVVVNYRGVSKVIVITDKS